MSAQAFVFSAEPDAGEHSCEVAFPGDGELVLWQDAEDHASVE